VGPWDVIGHLPKLTTLKAERTELRDIVTFGLHARG
jgi:hypothetical protein